ncbi:MAG TPA: hypothetical protein PLW32_12025 [Chitinophagaceae bacterium]|jgi:hypothetical protein|nr:hypothetical protein [Chitinophagaceae bacterium]MBP9740623.1 hypothetical protein [Chitinophagaceae bacterium]HPH24605.1 hypothetical protein [Chitinophagaceae bacterium]
MRTIILLFSLVVFGSVHAQTQLANDQNPNYLVSQQKYLQLNDSMQAYMNVTEQNTYKAYDWYEAKMERKQNRISTRQQVRINRSLYSYDNWNNGWNNNYSWNNNFRNRNRWNNNYGFFPGSIGYRTGNWWFWF